MISDRSNVIQPGKDIYDQIKGNWSSLYFKNSNPIVVELACGKGEYSVALASRFPDKNFIGVDIKGDRLWKGSTLAVEQELQNVVFIRANIMLLENFFKPLEVAEIWIPFPDPRPKKRDVKRRLTSQRFLDIYKKIIKPHGYLRLKTDNDAFFDYTLDELMKRDDVVDLQFTDNVYESKLREECFDVKTHYEDFFSRQGQLIKYLRFRFKHL